MNSTVHQKIESILSNIDLLKSNYRFTSDTSKYFVSLQYAMKSKEINLDAISKTKAYIKKNTGLFSAFSGEQLFIYSALLPLISDIPTTVFDQMKKNIPRLKSVGFKSSTYHPTALYCLETIDNKSSIESILIQAKKIYDDMKKNHPFLTSGDDYALSILMAHSKTQIHLLEAYYEELNTHGFSKSNGLQALSHILAINSKDISSDCSKVKAIYDDLKSRKLKVSTTYYPVLGVLSLLDTSIESVTQTISEIVEAFKKQKGFRFTEKGLLILIATTILVNEKIKKNADELVSNYLNVTIQGILAAQQAAMIVAISAGTTAAIT